MSEPKKTNSELIAEGIRLLLEILAEERANTGKTDVELLDEALAQTEANEEAGRALREKINVVRKTDARLKAEQK